MNAGHRVLLVEDEDDVAEEIRELLESFGMTVDRVANQRDAEERIAENDYCLILLDLQIPMQASSAKAIPEAGPSVLRFARRALPKRNGEGAWCTPVVVSSAHAKERDLAARLVSEGADRCIVDKPLRANKPSFGEKIEDALRRAGRPDHARCAVVNREARGEPGSEAAETAIARIVVTGTPEDERLVVKIDDKPVALQPAIFEMLLRLVCVRLARGVEGSVDTSVLAGAGDKSLVHKQTSRLNADTRHALPRRQKLAMSRAQTGYRINPKIIVEFPIDTRPFRNHFRPGIPKLAAEIDTLQSKMSPRAPRAKS